jgi:hypothetical protein
MLPVEVMGVLFAGVDCVLSVEEVRIGWDLLMFCTQPWTGSVLPRHVAMSQFKEWGEYQVFSSTRKISSRFVVSNTHNCVNFLNSPCGRKWNVKW